MAKQLLAIPLLIFSSFPLLGGELCHYDLYRYNVKRKSFEGPIRKVVERSKLPSDHVDQKSGCSVCEEDQVEIDLNNGKRARICRFIAAKVEKALNQSLISGFKIMELEGYLVKMTRGEIDREGYRTGLSNHSFGLSIDVNRSHNGLYSNCLSYTENCELMHGGTWSPEHHLSITSDSTLVDNLRRKGFAWGGAIEGAQKDFMHFSPSGY